MKSIISIPEQLKLNNEISSNIIKLPRATKAGVPNVNGYTYSKEVFDEAMNRYFSLSGKVYLAPVEDELYASFTPNERDYFGDIVDFDNDTISVKMKGLSFYPESYLPIIKAVLDNKMDIRLRYSCESNSNKVITRMGIMSCDISALTDKNTDKTISTMPWGDWIKQGNKSKYKPQLPTKNKSKIFDWE